MTRGEARVLATAVALIVFAFIGEHIWLFVYDVQHPTPVLEGCKR